MLFLTRCNKWRHGSLQQDAEAGGALFAREIPNLFSKRGGVNLASTNVDVAPEGDIDIYFGANWHVREMQSGKVRWHVMMMNSVRAQPEEWIPVGFPGCLHHCF